MFYLAGWYNSGFLYRPRGINEKSPHVLVSTGYGSQYVI